MAANLFRLRLCRAASIASLRFNGAFFNCIVTAKARATQIVGFPQPPLLTARFASTCSASTQTRGTEILRRVVPPHRLLP